MNKLQNKEIIIITGGGTGGHLVIVKVLKEAALAKGFKLIYVGSTYGQDRKWFENDKDFKACYFFKTSGVVNQGKIGKIFALFKIMIAFFKARILLKKYKVKAVISVGGYSAAALSFAALSKKIPLYIHEQNATIGKLNHILKPKATAFFSSYEDEFINYPVREEFFAYKRLRDNVKTVIFLGGSQGATFMNNLALSLAPILTQKGIKIIHQCGEKNFINIQKAYKKLSINVTLFAFTKKILDFLQVADIAIARAGASTVWELTALQLPAIFIPYPYAANDHQAANVQNHLKVNASWMIRQADINHEKIINIIDTNVKKESQNLKNLLHKGGALEIIKKISIR